MIIVGNGPSILDKPLGNKIDQFPSIVRFNDYKILSFEAFTGEKTTHWWNTVNFQNLQHPLLSKDYQEVCLHSWQFNKEKDKLWERQNKIIRAENTFKSLESWIFELQQFGDTKYYGFSTGLLAIWYYLKSYENLTITGFDWWENRSTHHFADNAIRGDLHKPQEEKKIIDKLLNNDRLRWLV